MVKGTPNVLHSMSGPRAVFISGVSGPARVRTIVWATQATQVLFSNPQTNKPNMQMKIRIITFLLAAFAISIVQAALDTASLQYRLTVTPEIKRAFHSTDSIKIKSVTGTAPKFQTGGTYRIKGSCSQRTLKNAILCLGNTAEAGSDAIRAAEGTSLSKPLRDGSTEFDITFTLLRPGLLHVIIYDLDNHDKNDNAYAGLYLGDVVFRH